MSGTSSSFQVQVMVLWWHSVRQRRKKKKSQSFFFTIFSDIINMQNARLRKAPYIFVSKQTDQVQFYSFYKRCALSPLLPWLSLLQLDKLIAEANENIRVSFRVKAFVWQLCGWHSCPGVSSPDHLWPAGGPIRNWRKHFSLGTPANFTDFGFIRLTGQQGEDMETGFMFPQEARNDFFFTFVGKLLILKNLIPRLFFRFCC